ncbi:MAG: fatty acid desaturase family protein [Betaproteobacteria bacterium]|nr:fatty acid desaturase [Rhodocyclaceae bacterium]MCE2897084.1 fatty acid desaturase [Betaproteobacteria bacterium]
MNTRSASLFRSPRGALPNLLALGWTLLAYPLGIGLLMADPWWANLAGVLVTAHGLVFAAYYIHEFAHHSIFRSPAANQRWGVLMTWLTGACYATFEALRRKHMRHHLDRADVLTFDYKAFLDRSPRWVGRAVAALEWAYVPAVELIMHGYVMVLPFLRKERAAERPRLLAVMAVRAALFGLLAWVSPKALVLHAVAWILMAHVLRFTDAYQHTFDAFAVLEDGAPVPADKVRDRDYEQANTYSNLVSVAHPWLNTLLLNFAYHNAHHERPIVPWHDLPRLHRDLFGEQCEQVIPMADLLRGYHRDRVKRITSADYGEVGSGPGKAERFLGAYGVSFLTAV